MRVVSGIARGLRLETIVKNNIRPTTDKVKESVFNILQFDIIGKRFLDLFGGTGQIGIEAASRGASKVIIVENNREAFDVIKRNIKKLKDKFKIEAVFLNSVDFLVSTKEVVDIAFLDPPYGSGLLNVISKYIDRIMNKDGLIVCESSIDAGFDGSIGRFDKIKEYKYGKILISVYKNLKD